MPVNFTYWTVNILKRANTRNIFRYMYTLNSLESTSEELWLFPGISLRSDQRNIWERDHLIKWINMSSLYEFHQIPPRTSALEALIAFLLEALSSSRALKYTIFIFRVPYEYYFDIGTKLYAKHPCEFPLKDLSYRWCRKLLWKSFWLWGKENFYSSRSIWPVTESISISCLKLK